jgi:hypothetical protein
VKVYQFSPLGRVDCAFGIVNALLAIGLTFASLLYVRPQDCGLACDAPQGTPCPSGACRIGEQRAGWPLPVVVDAPGGGSPTSGWGRLGPEDPPIPGPFVADILFYSILLWLASYGIQIFRGKPLSLRLIAVALPLTALLATFVWLIYAVLEAYIAG